MNERTEMQRVINDLTVIASATVGLVCHTVEIINENSAIIITWGTMIYVVCRAYQKVKEVCKERKVGNGNRKRRPHISEDD